MQDLKIAALEIKVDGLYSKLEEFETSQKEFNNHLQSDVQKIARGLYGDEHNQSKGLIDRLVDLEDRVRDLEKTNNVDEIKGVTLSKAFNVVWKTTAIVIMVWLTFKQVIGVDVILGLIK
jgi:ClpP class serine protease